MIGFEGDSVNRLPGNFTLGGLAPVRGPLL